MTSDRPVKLQCVVVWIWNVLQNANILEDLVLGASSNKRLDLRELVRSIGLWTNQELNPLIDSSYKQITEKWWNWKVRLREEGNPVPWKEVSSPWFLPISPPLCALHALVFSLSSSPEHEASWLHMKPLQLWAALSLSSLLLFLLGICHSDQSLPPYPPNYWWIFFWTFFWVDFRWTLGD